MKYITKNKDGSYEFSVYFDYIESIKDKISQDVYSFASDWSRYSLNSEDSLHDSWLEGIEIIETGNGSRGEIRSVKIILKLLGPYHDRYFIIQYDDVRSYAISGSYLGKSDKGHSDLIVHEVRLDEDGFIIHEIEFDNGSKIIITCSGFICSTDRK